MDDDHSAFQAIAPARVAVLARSGHSPCAVRQVKRAIVDRQVCDGEGAVPIEQMAIGHRSELCTGRGRPGRSPPRCSRAHTGRLGAGGATAGNRLQPIEAPQGRLRSGGQSPVPRALQRRRESRMSEAQPKPKAQPKPASRTAHGESGIPVEFDWRSPGQCEGAPGFEGQEGRSDPRAGGPPSRRRKDCVGHGVQSAMRPSKTPPGVLGGSNTQRIVDGYIDYSNNMDNL